MRLTARGEHEREWVAVAVQRQEPEQQQPHRARVRPAVLRPVPDTPAHDVGAVPHRPAGQLSPAQVTALQRSVGNAAVARALQRAHDDGPDVQRAAETSVHEVLRTPGTPLAPPVRADMESRLGADFGDVRVHADSAAQRSAAEIGARAYTSGNHIVVGAGGDDQHTLAHELTHVIQQRSGTVAGTDHGDGLRISDPSDRFEREAEANATRALAEPPAPHAEDDAHHDAHHTTGAAAGGSSAAVQQAPAVQRAIGDIGEAAIGRLLRRQGRQAAGFKVNKAERTSTGWRYEVQDKNGFAPARWVDGTDDEFDLAEAPQVSAEEQAVQQQINTLLQAAPTGGAQSLLDGRPAGEAAAMVGMGETQKAVGQMNVLWSGGASDCVIVAAVADGKGWISHVDRSGPSPATIINAVRQVGTGRVYLASQVFTRNDSAASELVRSIVKGLTDQGIAISAIFPSSSLGVNAGTGTVVANLSRTDIDILKGNEAI